MVTVSRLISTLKSIKVLVAGDLLLDVYTFGKAKRISPEAPVAVVHVQKEERRPGGAGNVILNLISLGARVAAIGRVRGDWAGEAILEALRSEGVDLQGVVHEKQIATPVKNRVIADYQQIVRIDREEISLLNQQLEQSLIDQLEMIFADVDVLALSDYGKGMLTPTLLSALILEAKRRGIPVITDPKGIDFGKYSGSTLIKPNLLESYAAAGLSFSEPLEKVANALLSMCRVEHLMITRSEEGISLFSKCGKRSDFPVLAKEVKDVTGAGDTVLAMLCFAVAHQLDWSEAVELCNLAASIAIEHLGCARITLADLACRSLANRSLEKVFDKEHLFILQKTLHAKPFDVLLLDRFKAVDSLLYQALKTIACQEKPLLVYANRADPLLISLLASLKEVDFILSDFEDLQALCKTCPPERLYGFDAGSGGPLCALNKTCDHQLTFD